MKNLLKQTLFFSENWQIVSAMAPVELPPVAEGVDSAWHDRHEESHRACEILLALSGRTICRFNGDGYRIEPGAWMIFLDGDRHDCGYRGAESEALHVWCYLLPESVLMRFVKVTERAYESVGVLYPFDDAMFAGWLWHEFAALRRLRPDAATAHFHLRGILQVLGARMLEVMERPQPGALPLRMQIIRQAQLEIVGSRGRDISAERLARWSGYSVSHFLRLFKEATGKTLGAYIDEVRVNAFHLLEQQRCSRKEIAAELGFSSASALAHWRKQKSQD